ncbi:3-ketoacyl-ACP reductase [Alteribacter lacisalsi]|uniref:3-ketoacyl-ACP reductase n=1 Tax=Alteribacter lacisalsi TaxID=2045244 RepID=A0A2W0H6M2_9BACI|nr:3-ketoacyl-ACP reductase [Alteribacter lacisalsi]PYZ97513.1 3-ketoacyl-ACP reductase [Alteribacter lacisalsi]
MQSLEGKTALITGGSRGIGLATAKELAKEGVRLGLIGRSEEHLASAEKELKDIGATIVTAAADVADENAAHKAVKTVEQELGGIDILINNAGIAIRGTFAEIPADDWRRGFDVNVMGIVHVTQAALPGMIERNRGDIINISSMSGLKGTKGSSAYSATKFAVIGMSEGLMQEVRPHNIRVSVLTPSLVETDLTRGDAQRDPEKYTQAEDLAEFMVSQLKLEQRTFVKTAAIWATNPF